MAFEHGEGDGGPVREIIEAVERWRTSGRRVAIARVVGLDGSGPRDPGATMAVSEDGEVAGSVSGGCVEAAVVTEALAAIEDGTVRMCRFGYSDDDAFAIGLSCGGTIHLLIDPHLPVFYDDLCRALHNDQAVALATVFSVGMPKEIAESVGVELGSSILAFADGRFEGSIGGGALEAVVARDAIGTLASGVSATRHYGPRGEARQEAVSVFIEVFAPPPHLVIFGAVDFTAALAKVAKVLGYRVTVCDARPTFATVARFPMADEVVVDWPDRYLAKIAEEMSPRDAICVLTHDAKFDVPAIVAALSTAVGYIGAMGSARTHEERVTRLRDIGASQAAIARVMSPIGIDIGARTPEETAVAICAEIVALRTGRPVPSLRGKPGRIHEPTQPTNPPEPSHR